MRLIHPDGNQQASRGSCHYTTAGRQEGPRLRVRGGLLSMIQEIRAAAVGLVAAEDDHATIN
jgi:hypothetical protein